MIIAFNQFHRLALFNLKPIRPIKNLSKMNDEGSFHFCFICYMSLELLYLTSTLVCCPFSADAYQMPKVCMDIPSLENFDQKLLKHHWLGAF